MEGLERAKSTMVELIPEAHLAGPVCWVAWVLIIFSGVFSSGAEGLTVTFTTYSYAIVGLSTAATLVICGLQRQRVHGFLQKPKGATLMAAVGSIGVVLVLFSSSRASLDGLFVLGNILAGFGISWTILRSGMIFSEYPPRKLLLRVTGTLVAGFFIYQWVIDFEPPIPDVVVVVLPVLGIMLSFLEGGQDLKAHVDGNAVRPPHFFLFMFSVLLLFMAFSVFRGYYPQFIAFDEFTLSRNTTTLFCFAGFVVVFLFTVFLKDERSIGSLCYWTLAAFAFVFALAPIMGFGSTLSGSFFTAANVLCRMMIIVLLGTISYKSGTSTIRTFGFGYAAVVAGCALGNMLGLAMFQLHVNDDVVSVAETVLTATILFLILASVRQSDFIEMTKPMVAELDDESSHFAVESASNESTPWWKLRMENIGERFELSQRETEVLKELGKGKDMQTVASDLGISYSTARTHVRSIYTKCNVHSRHELQTIIDSDEYRIG